VTASFTPAFPSARESRNSAQRAVLKISNMRDLTPQRGECILRAADQLAAIS
jgi:hypothetical protein